MVSDATTTPSCGRSRSRKVRMKSSRHRSELVSSEARNERGNPPRCHKVRQCSDQTGARQHAGYFTLKIRHLKKDFQGNGRVYASLRDKEAPPAAPKQPAASIPARRRRLRGAKSEVRFEWVRAPPSTPRPSGAPSPALRRDRRRLFRAGPDL